MLASFFRDFRIWLGSVRFSFALSLSYRIQTLIWMIGGFMPLAMMLIWTEVAKEVPLESFSPDEIAFYFLTIYLIAQINIIFAIELLNWDIRKGELTYKLIRPAHPVIWHMAEHTGEILLRGPIILTVFLSGLFLMDVDHLFSLSGGLLFIPSLALAWLLVFNMFYCLGLLAFWVENAEAFDPLLWSCYSILGGSIVPLVLFPDRIETILYWLPFQANFHFPAMVMMDRLTDLELIQGFALQVFWVVVFILLRRFIWTKGLKKYGGIGI